MYIQVSDYPLMSLEPDDRGTFIAVGSENGNMTILELSHHLIELQKNEKNIFLSVRTTAVMCIAQQCITTWREVKSNNYGSGVRIRTPDPGDI